MADIQVIQKNDPKVKPTMVKATIIDGKEFAGDAAGGGSIRDESKEITEDFFAGLAAAGEIIVPPYDLYYLASQQEHSSELGQCVDAMEVNIEAFGFALKVKPLPKELLDKFEREILEEERRLMEFFELVHPLDSFTGIRRKMRHDMEMTGNGYWEMVLNDSGALDGLNHIPSHTVRLGKQGDSYDVEFPKLRHDGSFEIYTQTVPVRFRKFVQELNGQQVWFRQWGDPRIMDCRSGEYVEGEKLARLPYEYRASSLLHFRIYAPKNPYGMPRWIGNMHAVSGSRAAADINYATFKNNNIPSMAILVENGMLTEDAIGRLRQFVEKQIRGSDNYSKFIILEGEPMDEGIRSASSVKIHFERLASEQRTDMLFQEYDKNNADKIRRSFRLPPVYVGSVEGYNRATSQTSRLIADEQVFAPERREMDYIINHQIMTALGAKFHIFQTRTPDLSDNMEIIRALNIGEKTGAITPRISHGMFEDVFNRKLQPIDPNKVDPDQPFMLTMAETTRKSSEVFDGVMPNRGRPRVPAEAQIDPRREPAPTTKPMDEKQPALEENAISAEPKRIDVNAVIPESTERKPVVTEIDTKALLDQVKLIEEKWEERDNIRRS
jgi:PBSX family phage portal protein